MNTASHFILFLTVFFTASSFAGESLAKTCYDYESGTSDSNLKVLNYNFNTIDSSLNIYMSNGSWYSVKASNNASHLYDIAKTARLTGVEVDICYDSNGRHLLGIEWTKKEK